MVKQFRIHTYERNIPEIIDICEKNNLIYQKPLWKKIKDYEKYRNFGIMKYHDIMEEWCPDKYYVVYFNEDKNKKNNKTLKDIHKIFYNSIHGSDPKTYCKTFYFKYDKYDYLKEMSYILPSNPIPVKYPIYIISLGRYSDLSFPKGTCMTLEKMKVKYRLCVMTREVENYNNTLKRYNCQYCMEIIHISDNKGLGGTPQRNKCWEHARAMYPTLDRHWILDDNIDGYFYFNRLRQTRIDSGVVFRNLEEIVENIQEPVALISHNYFSEVRSTELRDPFTINGKNFSSILINHRLLDKHGIKWRLKYNEDIDLGLQVLEKGLYTMGYNIFISGKTPTKDNKEGGNKDIYDQYKAEGFRKKLDCLKEAWGHMKTLIKETTERHVDHRVHHLIDWNRYFPQRQTKKGHFVKKQKHLALTVKQKLDWKDYNIKEVIGGKVERKNIKKKK